MNNLDITLALLATYKGTTKVSQIWDHLPFTSGEGWELEYPDYSYRSVKAMIQ